jgi:hypothetical protein
VSDVVPVQRTLQSRFGVVTGQPSVLNTSGDHVVYTPASGQRGRLKWISLYSDPDNTQKCVVTVKWEGASGPIYMPPFPAGYGAFMHSSVREGLIDERLIVNLSADQTIYVAGLDQEDFL